MCIYIYIYMLVKLPSSEPPEPPETWAPQGPPVDGVPTQPPYSALSANSVKKMLLPSESVNPYDILSFSVE